jgi:hypothetical protein
MADARVTIGLLTFWLFKPKASAFRIATNKADDIITTFQMLNFIEFDLALF